MRYDGRWTGDSMTPTANQLTDMDASVAVKLGADYNNDATTLQPTELDRFDFNQV